MTISHIRLDDSSSSSSSSSYSSLRFSSSVRQLPHRNGEGEADEGEPQQPRVQQEKLLLQRVRRMKGSDISGNDNNNSTSNANISFSDNKPAWLNISYEPPVGEAGNNSTYAEPTRAPRIAFPTSSPVSTPFPTAQQSLAPTTSYVASTDTEIVIGTLRLYGTVYLLCFFVFCILRKYKPRLYNIRGWVKEIQCELAVQHDRYVGWIDWTWKVYQVTDDELLDQCGMDCLCFLRSLRLGWKLSTFGCLNAIWLLPLYLTAKETEETENFTDIFVIASVANIPSGDKRILAVVVAAYLMVLYALHHINKEYDWYIGMRHKFLSKRVIHNYAVYVSGIPPEYRSSFALREYFQKCSWNSAVVESHIAMDIPKLEAKVARRETVIKDLEHVMAKERKEGITMMHWAFPSAIKGGRVSKRRKRSFKLSRPKKSVSGGLPISLTEKVVSADAYSEELDKLNKEISQAINMMKGYNDKLRHHLKKSGASNSVLRARSAPQLARGRPSQVSRKKGSLFGGSSRSHCGKTDTEENICLDLSPVSDKSNEKGDADDIPDRRKVADVELGRAPRLSGGPSMQTLDTVGLSTSTLGQLDPIMEDLDATNETAKQTGSFETDGEDHSVSAKPVETVENTERSEDDKLLGPDEGLSDDEGTRLPASCETSQRPDSPPHPFLELIGSDPFFYNSPMNDDSSKSSAADLPPMTTAQRAQWLDSIQRDHDYEAAFHTIHDADSLEEEVIEFYREGEDTTNSGEESITQGRDMDGSDYTSTDDEENKITRFELAENDSLRLVNGDRTLVNVGSESSLITVSTRGNGYSSGRSQPNRRRRSSLVDQKERLGKHVQSGRRILGDAAKDAAKKSKHATKKSLQVVGSASSNVAGKVLQVGAVGVTGVKRVAEYGVNSDNFLGATLAAGGALVAESATLVVPMLAINKEDGQPREAGFLVFRDLYTTQAALQMLQHPAPNQMVVEPAPSPKFIYWPNVGLSEKARSSGRLLSLAATITLCFFWSIPIAILSSFTEVNSLKESLPLLARWTETVPWLEGGLALVAPVLLLFLNECILPGALLLFSTWEGHIGNPTLEAAVFIKMSAFMIIQTFFVSAISGSITAELANILDHPEGFVTFLANSLPAQSSYFIQIIFVFTFFVHSGELLRVYPLGLATVRRFVGPNLTKKERKQKWGWIHSLEDPPDFFHAETFAHMGLFYMVYFVYSCIAPLTCFFLVFCFGVCETGYRYHFIHNIKPEPDSGGKLWRYFIQVSLASMLIAEMTLLGFLALKKAVYAIPTIAPLLAITVLYMTLVIPKKSHASLFLPSNMCVEIDQKYKAEEEQGMALLQEFKRLQYLQPALQHPTLYPDMDVE